MTNAEFQQLIREYMAEGMNEKEAADKAYDDMMNYINENGENW